MEKPLTETTNFTMNIYSLYTVRGIGVCRAFIYRVLGCGYKVRFLVPQSKINSVFALITSSYENYALNAKSLKSIQLIYRIAYS